MAILLPVIDHGISWSYSHMIHDDISNNMVCATSKGSDQTAHMRSLIRDFASRMYIVLVLSCWLTIIWGFYA